MQVSVVAATGWPCSPNLQKRSVLSNFGRFCDPSSGVSNLCMVDHRICHRSRPGILKMGSSLTCSRICLQAMFRSKAKSRMVTRAQASDEDLESAPLEPKGKSSGSVLPYVGVACLGAILFGYHLGVVNGALEYLATDLGIVENTVLQGWIVSSLLAGATIGSFTGGALADKFGQTRTFQLDVVPLALGALLCTTAQSVQTMIIGRFLDGIGIGITSAIVPLYIQRYHQLRFAVHLDRSTSCLYVLGFLLHWLLGCL